MTNLLISVLHILHQALASVLQRGSGLRLLLQLLYMLLQLTQLSPELLLCHAGPEGSQLPLCRGMHSYQLNSSLGQCSDLTCSLLQIAIR